MNVLPAPERTTRRIRMWVLLLSIAWCGVQIAVPGRFPQEDEAIFKEPGYQLAANGVMIAPPFRGFFALSPDISETFAIYQPLYSVGYAGWLKCFPHTFRTSVAYDALIHLGLVIVVMLGLHRIVRGLKAEWAAAIAGVYNLLGTLARPDELAMVFGYSGLALWFACGRERKPTSHAVAGGVLLGLCCATSAPASLVLGMWGGISWLALPARRAGEIKRAAVVLFWATATAAAVLVPFYLREGAITQYRQHAQWFAFAGLARSIKAGSLEPITHLLISGFYINIYMYPMIAVLLGAGAVVHGRGCVGGMTRTAHHTRIAFASVLAVYGFIILCLPQGAYYWWFLVPVLMASVVAAFEARWAAIILLAVATTLGGNRFCRGFLNVCTLPAEQSLAAAERALTDHVPSDGRLLVNSASYFVARRQHVDLYVKRQEMPGMLSEVEYCAWSSWWLGDVDGVMVPVGMFSREEVAALKSGFRKLHDSLPSTPPRFLGIPIGREPRGFGMVIYGRKTTPDHP